MGKSACKKHEEHVLLTASLQSSKNKEDRYLHVLVELYATGQLRYIRTTHTRIIRSYFAYTRMSIRVYAYVHARVYVPLLCILISFFI